MSGTIESFAAFDSLLTEEERLLRDTLRQFVTREVEPLLTEHHRRGAFPTLVIGHHLTGFAAFEPSP